MMYLLQIQYGPWHQRSEYLKSQNHWKRWWIIIIIIVGEKETEIFLPKIYVIHHQLLLMDTYMNCSNESTLRLCYKLQTDN